eukprot:COSAG04_NODE_174_length_21563_cov_12.377003_10_plen_249_part_00
MFCNCPQKSKGTELAQAAQRNELQTMERLIAGGVSADAKDGGGAPALVWATQGGHLDALTLLRRHGANLEATNRYGQTALMKGAQLGRADCSEALLEWGADKDAASNKGSTALHLAAMEGQLECARLLVRARADRAKKNKKGKTALEVASEKGKGPGRRRRWRRPVRPRRRLGIAPQGHCRSQRHQPDRHVGVHGARVLEAQVRRAWVRLRRVFLRHDALGDACSGASLHGLPWRRRHGGQEAPSTSE